MIQNYQKEIIIRGFIYNKIQQGYTVKKTGKDTYEFKIKTKRLDISEKIHCDNFLSEFLDKDQEFPALYANQFKEKNK